MKNRDEESMKIEAVRQAELSREDLDLSDEFDAAIYSMWYLMNPQNLENRDSVGTADFCECEISEDEAGSLKFTAHAHHNKPIQESPDDTLLYARLSRTGRRFIHFITDRFRIFRVR